MQFQGMQKPKEQKELHLPCWETGEGESASVNEQAAVHNCCNKHQQLRYDATFA